MSNWFNLDSYKNIFDGFMKGFIFTAVILLSLTGLYFLGYYVGKVIL